LILLSLASEYPDLIDIYTTNCEINTNSIFGYPNLMPIDIHKIITIYNNNITYNEKKSVCYTTNNQFHSTRNNNNKVNDNNNNNKDNEIEIPDSLSLVEQSQRYKFHISLPGNGASGRILSQIALNIGILILPIDQYNSIYTGSIYIYTLYVISFR
jgi:hypothetical protein